MKKLLFTVIVTLTTIIFAAEKAQIPSGALVVTSEIKKGMINSSQTFSGTLYYNTKSKIASQMEGAVDNFFFQEGQSVKKGQILASLDSQILEANIMAKKSMLKALKAVLEQQVREMNRTKTLFESKSISQSSYDLVFYKTMEQKAQVEAMENELNAMKIEMDKMRITAPFDCVVVERNVAVGEWLAKGTTVATLIEPQSIEARVNIPSDFLQNIHTYKSFLAKIGTNDVEISLKSVIPLADQITRTFPVVFTLPKEMGLIEGMRIDIDIPILKEEERLLVPRDAVIKRFEQDVVFVTVDGKAVMFPVKIIGYKTDMVAISAKGLSENMRVIIKGNERIFPDMTVIDKAHK